MSYNINYNNKNIEIDKYCLKNSSMGGSGKSGIWDTEEEYIPALKLYKEPKQQVEDLEKIASRKQKI